MWKKVNDENVFPNVDYRPADSNYGYDVAIEGAPHDAGYDAFMTGIVFLKMAVYFCEFSFTYWSIVLSISENTRF